MLLISNTKVNCAITYTRHLVFQVKLKTQWKSIPGLLAVGISALPLVLKNLPIMLCCTVPYHTVQMALSLLFPTVWRLKV